MKTVVGLIVLVALVLVTVVSCDTTPSEGYKDVTVGTMTVSIPDDWERPGDYQEIIGVLFTNFSEEDRQVIQADVYEDESGNAFMIIERIDMVGVFELDGLTWRGWDIELEEAGKTIEEFAGMVQENLTAGFTELTQEVHRQLTVGGREAWETAYTAKSESKPVRLCLLVTFAPDDVGALLIMVEQAEWEKFEGTWEQIRDSVRI